VLQNVQQVSQFPLPPQNDAKTHVVCCVLSVFYFLIFVFALVGIGNVSVWFVYFCSVDKILLFRVRRCHWSLLSMKLHMDSSRWRCCSTVHLRRLILTCRRHQSLLPHSLQCLPLSMTMPHGPLLSPLSKLVVY